jgi:hypothetical protein
MRDPSGVTLPLIIPELITICCAVSAEIEPLERSCSRPRFIQRRILKDYLCGLGGLLCASFALRRRFLSETTRRGQRDRLEAYPTVRSAPNHHPLLHCVLRAMFSLQPDSTTCNCFSAYREAAGGSREELFGADGEIANPCSGGVCRRR